MPPMKCVLYIYIYKGCSLFCKTMLINCFITLAMKYETMLLLLISLFCVPPSVISFKLTTLQKDANLTSLEERLTNLEQTIEHRLAVTERVIGQLLTGQADENLETLDVLSLRSGEFIMNFIFWAFHKILWFHFYLGTWFYSTCKFSFVWIY